MTPRAITEFQTVMNAVCVHAELEYNIVDCILTDVGSCTQRSHRNMKQTEKHFVLIQYYNITTNTNTYSTQTNNTRQTLSR